MDSKKNYIGKVLMVILGLCTILTVLGSLPSLYAILIFSGIGGPLMLLVGVAMCLFFTALFLAPFFIAYRLYKNSKITAVIVTGLLGILILVPIIIWMFSFDSSFIASRREYQNQIQNSPASVNLPAHDVPAYDKSDWKTYTDDTYGFEFMYPPHLTVAKGSHFGGGIPNPGEVQFALINPKGDLFDDVTPLLIVVFSVEPTKLKNNDEYLNLEQTYINRNEYIKDKWRVVQRDFFNMGPAVFSLDDSGTRSQGVHIVSNSSLFTLNDYSADETKIVQEVMNTFHFIHK